MYRAIQADVVRRRELVTQEKTTTYSCGGHRGVKGAVYRVQCRVYSIYCIQGKLLHRAVAVAVVKCSRGQCTGCIAGCTVYTAYKRSCGRYTETGT